MKKKTIEFLAASVITAFVGIGVIHTKAVAQVGVQPRSMQCTTYVSNQLRTSKIPRVMRGVARGIIVSQVNGRRNYSELVTYYMDRIYPYIPHNYYWRRDLAREAASQTIRARSVCN